CVCPMSAATDTCTSASSNATTATRSTTTTATTTACSTRASRLDALERALELPGAVELVGLQGPDWPLPAVTNQLDGVAHLRELGLAQVGELSLATSRAIEHPVVVAEIDEQIEQQRHHPIVEAAGIEGALVEREHQEVGDGVDQAGPAQPLVELEAAVVGVAAQRRDRGRAGPGLLDPGCELLQGRLDGREHHLAVAGRQPGRGRGREPGGLVESLDQPACDVEASRLAVEVEIGALDRIAPGERGQALGQRASERGHLLGQPTQPRVVVGMTSLGGA